MGERNSTTFATHEGEYGVFEGSAADQIVFGTYVRTGVWSPGILGVLTDRIFAAGQGTFVDIGANIGLVCIPLADRRSVRGIAVEPEPTNYSLLRRNIDSHHQGERIVAHNIAFYSKEAHLTFELSNDNFGDHRVRRLDVSSLSNHQFGEPDRQVIEVSAKRLDDTISAVNLRRPVVAKIDTQGSEVRILRGAPRFLEHVDFLIIEYWPYGLTRMGDRVEDFFEALRGFEYGVRLREASDPLATSARLKDCLPPMSRLFDNLLGIPKDGSTWGFADLLLSKHPRLPFPAPLAN